MNENEIIETAIKGHASTRDAIRWAIQQEREACAKVCEEGTGEPLSYTALKICLKERNRIAKAIRERGET
jgi:hypothetical protein